ncbi:prepilin signal peptidase PulO-like enzyme (type II secretory pathway) [Variovorax boronicumulans]|uniref:Prepilin signal peptidase PulO-like enzyme (Type II secretory pathway) n=2 Tax=Variovorax boronicumulans TaxID=436515 RepID=A0AAW8CSU5_9BURK|nr:A24 family peptidase [Variovorax boronicumulans]MDP9894538.1 prepilin signal peptidase PulO-like enzyme (type II secretory pathway) [Variovorax boronicumulans]MDP9992905.1 prepilin signal peptidase PulO-like enzyme (type II secretory pathway) [Variovorax boronicumulans]MDQ0054357.1 prepilin signal peptidase PulO-like enzyme (type II secretory pathway) [Variovorax boronicumulans]
MQMLSMPPNIEVLIAYALGGGAFAAFALLPWIRRIPLDMHRVWASEYQNYQPFLRDTSELDISKASRFAIVVGAALMCLGLALVRGASLDTAMLCLLLLGWILLTAINVRHELLPDRIVLALLWLGLLYRASTGSASDNVLGAVSGYLAPWLVVVAMRSRMGGDILGLGDLKAFAVAGAWFGWTALPTVYAVFVAVSLLTAAAFALRGAHRKKAVPTGPAHMVATLVVMLGYRIF